VTTIKDPRVLLDATYWSRQPESFLRDYELYKSHLKSCLDYSASRYGESRYVNLGTFGDGDITIREGRRVSTSSSVAGAAPNVGRVLVVGGSTVFCAEVPNDLTLPSQLSQQLAFLGCRSEVMNIGLSGATTQNRLEHLRIADDLRGAEFCVVYLGINDCSSGYWREYENGGWRAYRRLPIFRLLAMLRYLHRETLPQLLKTQDCLGGAGTSMLVVLQPCLLTAPPISAIHRMRKLTKTKWGFLISVRIGYRYLRRGLCRLAWSIDLSAVVGSSRRWIYVDWAHLNATGNQSVAKEIAYELARQAGVYPRGRERVSVPSVQTTFHAPQTLVEQPARGRRARRASDAIDPFNYPLF